MGQLQFKISSQVFKLFQNISLDENRKIGNAFKTLNWDVENQLNSYH